MKNTVFLFQDQWLFCCFGNLKDPRILGRCKHPLANILFIVICAMISGADGWESIYLFAQHKRQWLSQFLDLSNGLPCVLTYARVIARINPDELQHYIKVWFLQMYHLLTWDMIHIDGKTIKSSKVPSKDKKADHIVNAYASRRGFHLSSVKVPDKTNEIKAIPRLLKTINTSGCILTIDAMGTQRGIAKLIRKNRAHYVLSLKQNHKRLYRKVSRLFAKADQANQESMTISQWRETDVAHGRVETRCYTVLPVMYLYKYKQDWKDLSAYIRVESRREVNGKVECSVRYYLTSIPYYQYKKMGQAIRSHWSVENNLHWKLDVGLHEDRCRIRRDHACQNLSTLRKFVLGLLEREKSANLGIEMKRFKAANSTKYLRKVIGF